MTVAENVTYGLMIRKVAKAERRCRAWPRLSTWCGWQSTADRKPLQLSGGQRQRVALARSLVLRPKVLLLDEPLGALDLKLRQAMQIELKEIQQEVGLTFIYVTHDQEEALTMSDRLAVFSHGGSSRSARRRRSTNDRRRASWRGSSACPTCSTTRSPRRSRGCRRVTSAPRRSRWWSPTRPSRPDDCTATGHVREVVYLGAVTRYIVELDVGGSLVVLQQNLTTSSMEALQVRGQCRAPGVGAEVATVMSEAPGGAGRHRRSGGGIDEESGTRDDRARTALALVAVGVFE